MPTVLSDLAWWYAEAARLPWKWATTYADSAPHWYVTKKMCPGLDFHRAARVIHTFGAPGKFYRSTNIYLESVDRATKWWTMDEPLDRTDLVNMASTERTYGPQDAPSTGSSHTSMFDAMAAEWDSDPGRPARERKALSVLVRDGFGHRSFTVLDIGCGTGALLDTGLFPAALTTVVDESTAMLNRLVKKHPRVGNVVQGRWEDVAGTLGSFDLVAAWCVPKALDLAGAEDHVAPDGRLLVSRREWS